MTGAKTTVTPTKEQYKFILPALIALIAIVAFPTVFLFYVSFHEWLLFQPGRPFAGLGNFSNMVTSREFIHSIKITFLYVSLTTLATFVLGLALALILNEEIKARGAVRALITLPIIVPPVVAGFTWKFMLNREVGVIGGYLLPLLGLEKSLLGDPTLALISVVIADVWSKTSLMFLIILAGLQSISTELYEVAKIDGASFRKILRYVILPLLKPAIVVALILRFIDAFNTFDMIFVMTSGGPGIATQTLPLLGWKVGFLYFNLGEAAALAVIMLFMTIAFSLILIRRLSR